VIILDSPTPTLSGCLDLIELIYNLLKLLLLLRSWFLRPSRRNPRSTARQE
jgi:hypothetical protein